jgi:mevalonate kinase
MHRAFGKVILLGEHAVVYGHPALCGALADGVTVESAPGRGTLRIPQWDVALDAADPMRDGHAVGRAYLALRGRLGLGLSSPVDLTVHFAVPTGAGLGSSAAMAVAVARALVAAHDLTVTPALIADAAMAAEQVIHGKPSGLDHTVALEGGFGLFTRARGLTAIAAREPVRLVIGHTGRERDTKGRVARVAELLAEREGEVRERFQAIEKLVQKGRAAVEGGSYGELGAAMNENQAHLRALDVSCPEIAALCRAAIAAGAAGAKLTGGGGGGCVIALAPGRETDVQRAWERAGHRAFVTTVGAAA